MVKVKNPEEISQLVTKGSYEKKRIFSIVAHIDHGKTTEAFRGSYNRRSLTKELVKVFESLDTAK